MGTLKAFTFTERDIEDMADSVKREVVGALVAEKILDYDIAEQWTRTHTVIIKYKTFFRTLSTFWNRLVDDDGFFYHVVRLVE